jgi:hypothetical protein
MERDFTFEIYTKLITTLLERGAAFQCYSDFDATSKANVVLLRHDVDTNPKKSLRFAEILAAKGIVGTYYFRMVPHSYDERIIKTIVDLGHEVGYHYETMDTCNGNVDKAYDEFCKNLEIFRKLTPIHTISMHGSPLSRYDNRAIWSKYDYKKLGILAEPYFDINFNELYYITDTGRRWDGHLYNVRDKATKGNPVTNSEFLQLSFRTTHDMIQAIGAGEFPSNAMINFHPQRWHDELLPWSKELVFQKIKNIGKYALIKFRGEEEDD